MITSVHAREILDSRGNPTVEVEMRSSTEVVRAAVPSGASTGVHEAVELRDGDQGRYGGKGVLKAVRNVHEVLAEILVGREPSDQSGLDKLMIEADGTANKSKLGANAILGCSMAIARLAAAEQKKSLHRYLTMLAGVKEPTLPSPMMNVINGGQHADNSLDIQEFMIVPQAATFAERLRIGAEVFQALKRILQAKQLTTSVGDEGGFAPDLQTHEDAIGFLLEATSTSGHEGKVKIALDVAASEFYDRKTGLYRLEGEDTSAAQLLDYYVYLAEKYPIVSIEDPFAEDDWEAWTAMTERLGKRLQIVGDDLLVTNVARLRTAIERKACNAILIKPNQIGTVTEMLEALRLAKDHGYGVIVSHRSGDTEDTFIADLSVGLATGQIKTGSLSRSERICKYNQLLRIEEELAWNGR